MIVIDAMLAIAFIVATSLFLHGEIVRRKEAKARRDYISKIERDWFKKINEK